MQGAERDGVGQPGGCPADKPDGLARGLGGGVRGHGERWINYSPDGREGWLGEGVDIMFMIYMLCKIVIN